jgi:beta-lactamase class D
MSGKKLFFSRRLIHDLGITWATRYQPNLNSQFPISNWWDWPSINILLHDRIYFHMPWVVDREEPVKKIYINQSTFSSTQSLLATLTKTVSSSAGTDGKNIFKFYLNDAQKVCIACACVNKRWCPLADAAIFTNFEKIRI